MIGHDISVQGSVYCEINSACKGVIQQAGVKQVQNVILDCNLLLVVSTHFCIHCSCFRTGLQDLRVKRLILESVGSQATAPLMSDLDPGQIMQLLS